MRDFCLSAFLRQDEELQQLLYEVLSEVRLVNVSKSHNSALDAIEIACERNLMFDNDHQYLKPYTLIHCDTHADIIKSNFKAASIACWINKLISSGVVNEVYWILPDWTRINEWHSTFWEDKHDVALHNEYLELFVDGPSEQEIYVNTDTQKIFFEKPDSSVLNHHPCLCVKFYKLTLDHLPDMRGLKNIILDIDGDYFVNSGYDTVNNARYFPSIEELKVTYKQLFLTLNQKGIRPYILTAAESPNFVPPNYELPIKILLYTLVKKSAGGTLTNELISCKHNFVYKPGENLNIFQIIWQFCQAGTIFGKNKRTINTFLGPLLFDIKYLLVMEEYQNFHTALQNDLIRQEIKMLVDNYFGRYYYNHLNLSKNIFQFLEKEIFTISSNIEDIEIRLSFYEDKYKQTFQKKFGKP